MQTNLNFCSTSFVPLDLDIDAMPFTLRVAVDGYLGLSEMQVTLLERMLTEFFFHPVGRINGTITIYADCLGDIGKQARRIQLFLYSLRALISPALQFEIEFDYKH